MQVNHVNLGVINEKTSSEIEKSQTFNTHLSKRLYIMAYSIEKIEKMRDKSKACSRVSLFAAFVFLMEIIFLIASKDISFITQMFGISVCSAVGALFFLDAQAKLEKADRLNWMLVRKLSLRHYKAASGVS